MKNNRHKLKEENDQLAKLNLETTNRLDAIRMDIADLMPRFYEQTLEAHDADKDFNDLLDTFKAISNNDSAIEHFYILKQELVTKRNESKSKAAKVLETLIQLKAELNSLRKDVELAR